ncbi:hypothetical protein ACS0TY_035171 [Phlomoides rotata]
MLYDSNSSDIPRGWGVFLRAVDQRSMLAASNRWLKTVKNEDGVKRGSSGDKDSVNCESDEEGLSAAVFVHGRKKITNKEAMITGVDCGK